MATTTVAPGPDAQPQSAMGRLVGVFFSPKKTFGEIAARPSWLAPFAIIILLGSLAGFFVIQKTDWRSFFERQMSQNSRFDQMSQEQKDRILDQQMKYGPTIGMVAVPIATACIVLLAALVYWGGFNLFAGAGLGFGQSFGITSHAFLPTTIGSILAAITAALKSPGDVDPEHPLASNVAAFLPDGSPHWLDVLGKFLDIFSIWFLVLLAIGFAAANPRKVKPGTAFGVVFGIWAAFIVIRVGLAWVFS
ncbi:MAG TPA: YIP1 family protein [Candidatus Acidoferrales bacterium]|nr:YIP1 family protein [Candidatus Acidoferrales bacterium]